MTGPPAGGVPHGTRMEARREGAAPSATHGAGPSATNGAAPSATHGAAPSPTNGAGLGATDGAVPRLEMRGVGRRFGRHQVLRGIDLDVAPGERLVLAGPNGAGKTTLLRIAAGLLRPTTGTVRAAGAAPTDPAGRRGMSYLSQDAPVYAELTVREHVRWWSRVQGRPADPAGVDDWLDRAGLRRLAEERAVALSRGQRQRLAIAMAFVAEPDLLLLDEPTTALDAAGRAWLDAELEATRAALVLASHEPPRTDARVVRIEAGRIVKPQPHSVRLQPGRPQEPPPAREPAGEAAG